MNTAPCAPLPSDPESRPGLTSLVRTGRGLMTVQTEIVGEPAQLVTIVDFRGRVLKTWRSDFVLDSNAASSPERIRRWHVEIEAQVRSKLARLSRGRPQRRATETVGAYLFQAAIRHYASRDLSTAAALLRASALLLPEERRVSAALTRLEPAELARC